MESFKKPIYSRHQAIALAYNPDDVAPKLIAKGAGMIAGRIIDNAIAADVPVHKDAALVEELTRIDIGQHIPTDLYDAVAQILIFICELDKKAVKM